MPSYTLNGYDDPLDWDRTPTPIAQVRARHRKARRAFTDIQHARTHVDVWSGWSDFLIAAAGIYTKLRMCVPFAQWKPAWFSAKLLERKTDPLLQYVHQARNADEHGIHHVTFPHGRHAFSPDEALFFSCTRPHWDDELRRWIPDGPPGSAFFSIHPASGWLAPVFNRGVEYPVPTRHLERKIPHVTVYWAAKLTLVYLDEMISEAETGLT